MVNHIVMWNFRPELTEEERKETGIKMKRDLEALAGKIGGIISLKLVVNELESSNKDIALISTFESVEALNAYQVHPEHVKTAGSFKEYICDRACLDY